MADNECWHNDILEDRLQARTPPREKRLSLVCGCRLQPEVLVHSEVAAETGRRLLIGMPVYSCRHCGALFEHRAAARLHVAQQHKNQTTTPLARDPVNCCVCLQPCVSRDAYKAHLRLHIGDVPLECALCDTLFADRARLESHLRRRHLQQTRRKAPLPRPQARPRPQLALADYRCPDCNIKFRRRDDLRAHRRKKHGFSCACGYTGYTQVALLRHKKSSHPDWKFPCRKCDDNFFQMMDMAVHMDNRHPSNYSCSKCGIETSSLVFMVKHRQEHDCVSPTKINKTCTVCQLNTPGRIQLAQHMKKHGRPFECADCHQIAVTQEKANEHAQMHADKDAPFYCSICKLNFQQEGWATKHVEAYHGKRGKVVPRNLTKSKLCPVCLAPVVDMAQVSQHILDVHKAQRNEPSQCVRCQLWLQNFDDMIVHLRAVHKVFVTMPEQCPVCNNTVASQYSLNRHLNMVHPTCPYCGERQSTRAVFAAHVSAKHPGEALPEIHIKSKTVQPKVEPKSEVEIKTEPEDDTAAPANLTLPSPAPPTTPGKKGRPPKRRPSTPSKTPETLATADPSTTQSAAPPAPLAPATPSVPPTTSQSIPIIKQGRQCKDCNEVMSNLTKLKEHLKNVHFKCSYCKKQFLDLPHLQEHTCEAPIIKCSLCRKEMLRSQMQCHLNRNHFDDYVCCMCDVKQGTKKLLDEHYSQVHQNEMSPCQFCNEFFRTSTLKDHIRNRHKEKPTKVECPICTKKFSSKFHLKQHMVVHSAERPHLCPLCPNNFSQLRHLYSHLEIHLRYQPVPKVPTCVWCGLVCESNKLLVTHVTTTAACLAKRNAVGAVVQPENGVAAAPAHTEPQNGTPPTH